MFKELFEKTRKADLQFDAEVKALISAFDKAQAVKFSLLLSSEVLPVFEELYPHERVPRDCIAYLKSIEDFEEMSDWQLLKIRKYRELISAVSDMTVENAWDPELGLYLDCFSTDAVSVVACAIELALYGTRYALKDETLGSFAYGSWLNAGGATGRSLNMNGFLKECDIKFSME